MIGYVKVFRSLLESPIFDNERLLKVFMWCLLKASHKPYKAVVGSQIVDLKPGQFVYGSRVAAEELNIPYSTVYRYMKLLQELEAIEMNVKRKYSVITIVNWGLYQSEGGKVKHKRNDNETQMKTYNNDKNVKNNTAFGKPIIEPPKYPRYEADKADEPVKAEPMPDYMRKKYKLG